MNDKIRDLIIQGASSRAIRQVTQESGMITLQKAGINKVLRGETTLDEMLRVIDITESPMLKHKEPVTENANEFYWNIFEKTGSVNAFLMYKGIQLPKETFKRARVKKTSKAKTTKRKKIGGKT